MSGRLNDAVRELAPFREAKAAAQPDLFSVIEQVTANAGEVWRLDALNALQELARTRPTLTIEHLSPLCGATHDRRALGGILTEGKRRGWIENGGLVYAGAERHGRPIVQWHSRLYQENNQ